MWLNFLFEHVQSFGQQSHPVALAYLLFTNAGALACRHRTKKASKRDVQCKDGTNLNRLKK